MKLVLVCAALALAGCSGKSEPQRPTCDAAAEKIVGEYAASRGLEMMRAQLEQALQAACVADAWSQDALGCMMVRGATCLDRLTTPQREGMNRRVAAAGEAWELAKRGKAQPQQGSAGSAAGKQPIASPLPAKGPHPEYPTPLSAGTEQIFTLEDPDRGPPAPLSYQMPPRTQLTWTTHVHCEDGITAVACSAPRGEPPRVHWRVGKRGAELAIAEQMRGGVRERAYVYEAKPDGTPLRRLIVDSRGDVEEAALFQDGARFTARYRNGSNALAGCGSMAYLLDARRAITELRCLQWTGEAMRDTDGAAIRRIVRDARGFALEEARFGADGGTALDREGVHRVVRELDEHGRAVVERYRDAQGKPARSLDHCAGRRIDRDAHGAETRTTCVDADDRPTDRVSRVSITEYRYDAKGCRTGLRYLARDGSAAIDGLRVHGIDYAVGGEDCAVSSHRCLNIVEQPQRCGAGKPARFDYQRDAQGRVISTKHYAPDGSPGGDPMYQVFETRYQLDESRNQIGLSCYDAAGKAVLCGTTGFHARKATFDAAGRQLTETYFDREGAPSSNMGAASRRFQYDSYDHRFESVSFDATGALFGVRGAAIRRDLYDTSHRRFGIVLLDQARQPARYTGCYSGASCPQRPWHAVRIKRRGNGSVEANAFFDAEGQLIETKTCSATPCFD